MVGPPLGILKNATYGTGTSSMEDGDLFLLYTDGLFEVFSPQGEMYGHQRLMLAIRGNCHLPMPTLFQAIIGELGHFAGGESFTDDICIVGIDVAFGNVPDAAGTGSTCGGSHG
jgi:serine phosphatase RsbU (regulator of sigma subunit)